MKLRFQAKKQESGDVWSFFFEPIDKVAWQAGQSIRLEIPRVTWGIDERRFSISSAPFEQHIRITTRLSDSSFKQSLDKLQPGDTIQGHNIEGGFVWQDSAQPKLFVAGGIGITPYRSMIAQALHDKTPLDTTLLYSSKDQLPVFADELAAWQKKDETLYIHNSSQRLAIPKQSTLAPFWLDSLVYISGPEQMVLDLAKQFRAAGLPDDQLILDEFTGQL